MRSPRTGALAASAAALVLVLAGCAAQATPTATAPGETASQGASQPSASARASDTATAAGPPHGVEINPVTDIWVFSDEVAWKDLPTDKGYYPNLQALDSLPELPPIDSFDGQELADENGMVDIGDLQHYYIADCMADAGFEWRWVYGGEGLPYVPQGDEVSGYTIPGTLDDRTPGFQDALWGENDFMSPDYDPNYVYHWSTAGCHGYAVHATGQDDAN